MIVIRDTMGTALLFLSVTALWYSGAVIFLWRGLRRLQGAGGPRGLTFSVVIAARNEEKNIGKCLESVLSQDLPADRYEVIVVNDRSEDGTACICQEYARRYPRLSVIDITETPRGLAPKKYAVGVGVRRSRHEIVAMTDADCLTPPGWLATLDRYFTEKTGVVQGITVYAQPEGMNPFFYRFQAIDFLSHGVVAAAAIGAGLPINSNANNFAFRKQAFLQVGGYGNAAQGVVSGDDDLLLQRIAAAGAWSVAFMADQAGAVTTLPTTTLRGLFEQRKRWGSKTVNYSPRQVALLCPVFLFYCSIAATLVAGAVRPISLIVFAAMMGVKIAGEYLLMVPGAALFNQKQLRPYILPSSFIQLPLVLAAVVFGVFGKFSWKGKRYHRTVR